MLCIVPTMTSQDVCPSVRPFVTHCYCVETVRHISGKSGKSPLRPHSRLVFRLYTFLLYVFTWFANKSSLCVWTSGSQPHAIIVFFSNQTWWQYLDGDPVTGVPNASQSVSRTLDRPRVVAPSKTCGHVRSSRRRWRWAQCHPRSAAPTFGRIVLEGK